MIRNFFRETDMLSSFEESDILPKIVEILSQCKGAGHTVTNKAIIKEYGVIGYDNEARVRKIINYIRNNGIIPCLIASSKGYHVAMDAKEITDYEESLRGRESAIRKIRLSIHKQGVSLFGEEAMTKAAEETKKDFIDAEKKYKLSLKLKRGKQRKKKQNHSLRLRRKRY